MVIGQVEGNNGHQKHHRAGQSIEEELDRGILSARPAPDPDEQIHGDEHHLPEDIEEDKIHGTEDADHGGLHNQQTDHELLHPLADIGPGTKDTEGHDKGGQHDQQDADPVEAQGILNVQ
jgi:hypothetical protein